MADLRSQMIRMASELPKGDLTRRKLLAAVQDKTGYAGGASFADLLDEAVVKWEDALVAAVKKQAPGNWAITGSKGGPVKWGRTHLALEVVDKAVGPESLTTLTWSSPKLPKGYSDYFYSGPAYSDHNGTTVLNHGINDVAAKIIKLIKVGMGTR